MRLAISLLNFRPGKIGGAETYLRGLIAGLSRVKTAQDQLILITHRDNDAAIEAPDAQRICVDRGDRALVAARLLEAFSPYRARFAEQAMARAAADVILFPQQSIFPKRVAGRCVMTAVDVQHLILPANISRQERWFRRAIYPFSLRRADRVLAISEFTRQTLLQRCGMPAERVTTVPLGFEPPENVAVAGGGEVAEEQYVYYPAATWPHKNHAALFRTIAALRTRGEFSYRLVLSGLQTSHWSGLQRLIGRLRLEGVVVHAGFVPRDRVAQLYHGASAVVFPSCFEGFGLPVLEAVSYGKKTIVSRLPVFAEIGVPPAWQIDFNDPDQLLAALERPGPTRLEKTPWTWDQSARATLQVLREVADQPAEENAGIHPR